MDLVPVRQVQESAKTVDSRRRDACIFVLALDKVLPAPKLSLGSVDGFELQIKIKSCLKCIHVRIFRKVGGKGLFRGTSFDESRLTRKGRQVERSWLLLRSFSFLLAAGLLEFHSLDDIIWLYGLAHDDIRLSSRIAFRSS